MKPTKFSEQNKTLLKPEGMTDEECYPLPVFAHNDDCISCWRPSWRERLSILFFGRVWLNVLGTRGTQPPVWVWGIRSPFEYAEDSEAPGEDHKV